MTYFLDDYDNSRFYNLISCSFLSTPASPYYANKCLGSLDNMFLDHIRCGTPSGVYDIGYFFSEPTEFLEPTCNPFRLYIKTAYIRAIALFDVDFHEEVGIERINMIELTDMEVQKDESIVANEWQKRIGEGNELFAFLSMLSKNENMHDPDLVYKATYFDELEFAVAVLSEFSSFFEKDKANNGFWRLNLNKDSKAQIRATVDMCLYTLFSWKLDILT